jgi:hypothetical protein
MMVASCQAVASRQLLADVVVVGCHIMAVEIIVGTWANADVKMNVPAGGDWPGSCGGLMPRQYLRSPFDQD